MADNKNENMERDLEEMNKILIYCIEHMQEMSMMEQFCVIGALNSAAEQLKPLYLKHSCKENKGTFLFKFSKED